LVTIQLRFGYGKIFYIPNLNFYKSLNHQILNYYIVFTFCKGLWEFLWREWAESFTGCFIPSGICLVPFTAYITGYDSVTVNVFGYDLVPFWLRFNHNSAIVWSRFVYESVTIWLRFGHDTITIQLRFG
jgi:hypothetical protein